MAGLWAAALPHECVISCPCHIRHRKNNQCTNDCYKEQPQTPACNTYNNDQNQCNKRQDCCWWVRHTFMKLTCLSMSLMHH
jgi:hypothetical protein